MSIGATLRELGGDRSGEGLHLSAAVYDPVIVLEVAAARGIGAVEEPGGVRLRAGDGARDVLDAALDVMFRLTFESGFAP